MAISYGKRHRIINLHPPGFALALASLVTPILFTGCANPGPPRPPSLHLPAPVADLTAQRNGNKVRLRWTTPSQTTDDLAVKGPMTAQICRELGLRPGTPADRAAACAPILRLAVAPGPSEVVDTLPAPLCSKPSLLITYRIQILNSLERSAGDSNHAAFIASGAAPPPIDSLSATASESGAVLEWTAPSQPSGDQVEFIRTDLSSAPLAVRPAKPQKPHLAGRSRPAAPGRPDSQPAAQVPDQIHLKAQEPPAGTVDRSVKFGDTYMYVAERVRALTLGAHSLEIHSEPSSPVTVAMRDTFPPRSPAGLATIPSDSAATPYIDLSWEPNTEPDLAGYIVYRQFARPNGDAQGPIARLTPSPVTSPAYRDVAVRPGQRYIYWVTAVDASGNESAPSAKAQEVVAAEQN